MCVSVHVFVCVCMCLCVCVWGGGGGGGGGGSFIVGWRSCMSNAVGYNVIKWDKELEEVSFVDRSGARARGQCSDY